MNDDHAKFINDKYASGEFQEKASASKSERMAKIIAGLLAGAEQAAARGDEVARDEALEKASALQLKFAIDDAMLRIEDREGIEEAEFCRESNTPLIKAKRQLINELALLNRGKAVLLGEWQPRKGSQSLKYNSRAYILVYAHSSDLRFIQQLYASLLLQMQTMMAADERLYHDGAMIPGGGSAKGVQAWRVSYAYGWVQRVVARLYEAKRRQEAAETTSVPGAALVLADRTALVVRHFEGAHPKLRKHSPRHDDNDAHGRAAGRAAGDRADLGQKKVSNSRPRVIEA